MNKVIGSQVDQKGNFKFIHEETKSNEQQIIKEIFAKLSGEMLSRLADVSRDLTEDHETVDDLLDDIQFYIDTLKDNETYSSNDYGKKFINHEIKKHATIIKNYKYK